MAVKEMISPNLMKIENQRFMTNLICCRNARRFLETGKTKDFADYLLEVEFNYLNYVTGLGMGHEKALLEGSKQKVPEEIAKAIDVPYGLLRRKLDSLFSRTLVDSQFGESTYSSFFFEARLAIAYEKCDYDILAKQMAAMAQFLFKPQGKEDKKALVQMYKDLDRGLLMLGKYFSFAEKAKDVLK